MLARLVVTLFMIGHPDQSYQLDIGDDAYQQGLAACAMKGEILAQQWIEDHPKWEIGPGSIKCTIGAPPKPGHDI